MPLSLGVNRSFARQYFTARLLNVTQDGNFRVSSNRTGQKIGKYDTATQKKDKNRIFLQKRDKNRIFQENNLFFCYICILNRASSCEKGQKMGLQHDMDKMYFDAERREAKNF